MTKKLFVFTLVLAMATSAIAGTFFNSIIAEDLKAEMQSGKSKVLVVDARTAAEYRQGHLPGAISAPPKDGDPGPYRYIAGILPMDKKIPLVFYCRGYSCSLSQMAAEVAAAYGYSNIRIYRGGFPEWQQKGYKVAR